jgi:hypothetical protein
MTGKTNPNEKVSSNEINWILAAAAVLFFVAFAVQTYRLSNQFPQNVSIPSSEQVRSYCTSIGYELGWVSSSCDMDEVTCFRRFGELTESKCVRWTVSG